MERTRKPEEGDERSRSVAVHCKCSFCLYVFSLHDLSERDARRFRRHLQENHGLTLGQPRP